MGVLDVDQLLEPVSEESPCGEDLEYDLEFGELERAAQPVADQQIGDTVVEGQEPDWRTVRDLASGLFQRTKDLRVAVLLARAVVHLDGLAGFWRCSGGSPWFSGTILGRCASTSGSRR